MLEIDYQAIELDQWLSDTVMFAGGTPSDYIIFKTLPGLGATHGEIAIYLWRNSIIIEPNVPVIIGKRNALNEDGTPKYPYMFAVYGDVSQDEVEEYLKKECTPKKIVCTPEAYSTKVRPAIIACGLNLYQDFFLLLDECDKLIKDIGYRPKIVLPMKDFFDFKQKAMISATAIEPSNPMFAKHGFKILRVKPTFEYRKHVNLIKTNNVLEIIKKIVKENDDRPVFIFLNSTDLILGIIKALGIEDESKIFCAPKSVKKVRDSGYSNAFSDLPSEFAQYNFLTSRYFSAVDIFLAYQPNVIIVTNVYRAPFSMLDPYTDSIQIGGRFRNKFNKFTHVTNYDVEIEHMEEELILPQLLEAHEEHLITLSRYENVSTTGGAINLKQAIERTDIYRFIDDDKEFIYEMADNVRLDNRVKHFYQKSAHLIQGYKDTDYFYVNTIVRNFDVADADMLTLADSYHKTNLYKAVAETLNRQEKSLNEKGEIMFDLSGRNMRGEYPEIARIYDILKYDGMLTLGFNPAKCRGEADKVDKKNRLSNPLMIAEIKQLYVFGDQITSASVKSDLTLIYTKYGIGKKASEYDITNHYHCKRSTKNGIHVWNIQGEK